MTVTICDICNQKFECTLEEATVASALTLARLLAKSNEPIICCDDCEPPNNKEGE